MNVMRPWILNVPRDVVLCALFYLQLNCWTHHHYLETRVCVCVCVGGGGGGGGDRENQQQLRFGAFELAN